MILIGCVFFDLHLIACLKARVFTMLSTHYAFFIGEFGFANFKRVI